MVVAEGSQVFLHGRLWHVALHSWAETWSSCTHKLIVCRILRVVSIVEWATGIFLRLIKTNDLAARCCQNKFFSTHALILVSTACWCISGFAFRVLMLWLLLSNEGLTLKMRISCLLVEDQTLISLPILLTQHLICVAKTLHIRLYQLLLREYWSLMLVNTWVCDACWEYVRVINWFEHTLRAHGCHDKQILLLTVFRRVLYHLFVQRLLNGLQVDIGLGLTLLLRHSFLHLWAWWNFCVGLWEILTASVLDLRREVCSTVHTWDWDSYRTSRRPTIRPLLLTLGHYLDSIWSVSNSLELSRV